MGKSKRNLLTILILLAFIVGVALFINHKTAKKTESTEQRMTVKTDENPNLIRKKIMLKDLKRFKVKPNETTTQKETKHE